MSNTNDTSISFRTSHDLRGPLINIQGFAGELNSAIQKVHALVDEHDAALPAAFKNRIGPLLADDLGPCMEYLDGAIALLERRIRQLKTVGELTYSDKPADTK